LDNGRLSVLQNAQRGHGLRNWPAAHSSVQDPRNLQHLTKWLNNHIGARRVSLQVQLHDHNNPSALPSVPRLTYSTPIPIQRQPQTPTTTKKHGLWCRIKRAWYPFQFDRQTDQKIAVGFVVGAPHWELPSFCVRLTTRAFWHPHAHDY